MVAWRSGREKLATSWVGFRSTKSEGLWYLFEASGMRLRAPGASFDLLP